jgi:hypothetical protein
MTTPSRAWTRSEHSRRKILTKAEALRVIKLLSAMESWAFSQPNQVPDYLIEDIGTVMEILERIILEKNT